ncbi:disease resistance protein RPM1-like [Camellia sinensis]|uniref:disease resistance protein RPM1-like n=1 Tax=Camellia sinensis TaxID=4442 RepID=UPI001035AAF3|nr:disease resistance protein RPM1-like [Camellia sinensis]
MGHQRYHDRYGIPEQRSRSIGVNNAWYDCRGDALLHEEAELVALVSPRVLYLVLQKDVSRLEGLLTSVLRRYEGLLLAIVAISGLLSVKDQSSVVEWEKTYRSPGAELEGNNRLLGMKKILSLSYIDLPHYLKLCFLYVSVFPEDHLIEH